MKCCDQETRPYPFDHPGNVPLEIVYCKECGKTYARRYFYPDEEFKEYVNIRWLDKYHALGRFFSEYQTIFGG